MGAALSSAPASRAAGQDRLPPGSEPASPVWDARSGQTGKTITFAGETTTTTAAAAAAAVAAGGGDSVHPRLNPTAAAREAVLPGLGRPKAGPALFFLLLFLCFAGRPARTKPLIGVRIQQQVIVVVVVVVTSAVVVHRVVVVVLLLTTTTGRLRRGMGPRGGGQLLRGLST